MMDVTPADRNSARKVMIFIDGSNVHWGLKTYKREDRCEYRLDFERLQVLLTGNRDLVRTIYYGSLPTSGLEKGQTRFMEYLRSVGIQVVSRPLRTRNSANGDERMVEKGVDVALAVDLLALAWEDAFDVAIIFSGDGDYVGAVEHVMKKGKNVEILAFKRSCSTELRHSAIRTLFFEDIAGSVRHE